MKILVLDTSKKDRSAIKAVLASGSPHYAVFESTCADDALFRVAREKFDVVLADHTLSNIDGLQLLKALRRAATNYKTAIIMTSVSDNDKIALEYIEAGAHDFITKTNVTLAKIHRAHVTARHIFTLEQDLRESNETIKRLSYCDSVTGLANRSLLNERIQECIDKHAGAPTKIGLLYVHIDRLRYLDQNQGPSINELLLRKTVNRIRGCLRNTELFARLEGNFFAVMSPDVQNFTDAGKIAQRIIRVMERPIVINKIPYNSQASVGIALFPDNAVGKEDLEKFARMALEKARSQPIDRIAYYRSEMKAEYSKHFDIETGLREAITKQQFTLQYQPVFNPTTQALMRFEALIRWNTPERCYNPADFIPIAEESSLIMEIGRWVIHEAINQLSKWNAGSLYPYSMSINLSPKQLNDPQLITFIENTLQKANVPAHLIEFELTETALLENSLQNITTIGQLSAMGCTIALDDFGTGFSSFSHLKTFPINSIKIDRSLMPSSPDNKAENSLIRGLVAMINSLDLQVVAEGAETAEHAKLCSELNMDAVQGYYFARPMKREHIEKHYLLPS